MALYQSDLRAAARRSTQPRFRTLNEATAAGAQTAFLCHSHKDEELVRGLVQTFEDAGLKIYVDWADSSMPETPDRNTASRIQQKIRSMNLFLFLATANSMSSRWCPWEIGFADGVKPIDSLLVIPTSDGYTTHGAEYLDLYRRIDLANGGALATWKPRETTNGTYLRDFR